MRLILSLFFCLILFVESFAYSFVVFGDNQGRDEVFGQLIAKVNQEKGISFAVNNGDLTYSGRMGQFVHYKKMIAGLKVPVYNVIGNHDAVRGGWRTFVGIIGPLYYSFDFDNSHFIFLNNAFRESFDRQQFDWLKSDLAASKAEHKFVFMHKPVFDPSEIYKDHIMSGRAIIEELQRLFKKYKVDYVFAGHIHGYAKAEREGVNYIVTGGAGAPLYLPPEFGGFYHYVRMDVEGRKIVDRIVRVYE